MKESVSKNIKSQLSKIIEIYYELVRLELDNFRLTLLFEGVVVDDKLVHLTTTNCDKKINKRRKIVGETFYSQKKDIVDSFFLNLAKLFDDPKRNKPKSVPVMVKTISNNFHLFQSVKILEAALAKYEKEISKNNETINIIKEHRDKCLAHHDNKVHCNHLNSMSTNETRKLMDIIKSLVNSVSSFFNVAGISDSDINKIRSESFDKNTKLIEMFES